MFWQVYETCTKKLKRGGLSLFFPSPLSLCWSVHLLEMTSCSKEKGERGARSRRRSCSRPESWSLNASPPLMIKWWPCGVRVEFLLWTTGLGQNFYLDFYIHDIWQVRLVTTLWRSKWFHRSPGLLGAMCKLSFPLRRSKEKVWQFGGSLVQCCRGGMSGLVRLTAVRRSSSIVGVLTSILSSF